MGEPGMGWLMRPVLAGAIRYESLKNCDVNLEDIARINEALDVQAENERRAYEAETRRNR